MDLAGSRGREINLTCGRELARDGAPGLPLTPETEIAGTKKPACGRLLKDGLGLFLVNRNRL
jgi:hypothetical protein